MNVTHWNAACSIPPLKGEGGCALLARSRVGSFAAVPFPPPACGPKLLLQAFEGVKPFGGRRPGAFGATLPRKRGRDGASGAAVRHFHRDVL